MSEPKSPLARLVLVMILLSVAGTCVAGVQFLAADLLQQNPITAPAYGYNPDHMYKCQTAWFKCMNSCGSVSTPGNQDCESRCNDLLAICVNG